MIIIYELTKYKTYSKKIKKSLVKEKKLMYNIPKRFWKGCVTK